MSRTIFNAYNDIKDELEGVTEDYVFEAKQIIKHITGYTNKEILLNYTQTLTEYQESRLAEILDRRKTHYPLQYILEEWSFFGLPFLVGPGVLIPRQDTEALVENALKRIKDKKAPRVLDLCTGTGCIAIAIAKERTDASVTAVEKFDEALFFAEKNKELNRVPNMRILKGDVLTGAAKDMKYDLIVSNPPYITAEEMKNLQTEVTFEPASALFGGEDGLTYYRAIAKNYKDCLNAGGIIAFEIGEKQGAAVKKILEEAGFCNVETVTDIEDRQRVIFGTVHQI